jgi:hypothetical protein
MPQRSASALASARQGGFWFQLKSQKSRLGESITDGAYAAMMNAIRHDVCVSA